VKNPRIRTFWPPSSSKRPICDAGCVGSPSTGRGAFGGSMKRSGLPLGFLASCWLRFDVTTRKDNLSESDMTISSLTIPRFAPRKTWTNEWVWARHRMTQTFRWSTWTPQYGAINSSLVAFDTIFEGMIRATGIQGVKKVPGPPTVSRRTQFHTDFTFSCRQGEPYQTDHYKNSRMDNHKMK
jgi:hypothetical protein